MLKELGSGRKKKIDLNHIPVEEGSARCAPGESERFKESHNYIHFYRTCDLKPAVLLLDGHNGGFYRKI